MAWQKVAEGGPLDLANLGQYEGLYAEGDRGKLEVYLRWPLPEETVAWIQNDLVERGVQLTAPVRQTGGSATLTIEFVKAVWPLTPVATVILILVALALIIGFGLYIYTAEKFGIVGMALVGGLALGGLYMVSRLQEPAIIPRG